MPDFTPVGLAIQANLGTQDAPDWAPIAELRWADYADIAADTPAAQWPPVPRRDVVRQIPFLYGYTTDTNGSAVLADPVSGAPTPFDVASFLQCRIAWDASGAFASPPILTAYNSEHDLTVERHDRSICGGSLDTGDRSYLKANLFGADSGAVPAAPTAGPGPVAATDGTDGGLTFTGAAAWLPAWQSLAGDLDFIQYGATPAPNTAAALYFMLALFVGRNAAPGVFGFDLAIKYGFV
jgi:hypothetical protein